MTNSDYLEEECVGDLMECQGQNDLSKCLIQESEIVMSCHLISSLEAGRCYCWLESCCPAVTKTCQSFSTFLSLSLNYVTKLMMT